MEVEFIRVNDGYKVKVGKAELPGVFTTLHAAESGANYYIGLHNATKDNPDYSGKRKKKEEE